MAKVQERSAIDNPMCNVCRQVRRPDRYINCKADCKALQAYMICANTQEEAECSKAWHLIGERRSENGKG